jgi:DNA polymerase III epsilon subunit-like protein
MHNWHNTPIHFIDFEGSIAEGVLEYGVVTILNGSIQGVYTGLCKPKRSLLSSKFHGLEGSMLEDKASFAEYWELFSALRKSGIFASHNACVEDLFLRSFWPFHSQSSDFSGSLTPSWGPWLDTYALSRSYLKLKNYQLAYIIKELKLEKVLEDCVCHYCPPQRRNWHNALHDALAGAILLMYLVNGFFSSEATLAELIFHSHLSEKLKKNLQQSEIRLE